jgi:glycosyltransferase involved in cell wall biosynthesis
MKPAEALVSFVIPFQDFNILTNNIWKSFEQLEETIEVLLIHDSAGKLENHQIEMLVNKKPNIKYVNVNCGSAGIARNRGMREATGKWIVFWDSDDLGFPNKVLKALADVTKDVVVGNFCVSQEGKNYLSSNSLASDYLQIAINPGIWRFIFKSEVAKKCKFSDLKLGEDIMFLVEVGAFDLPLVIFEEVIYEYRISCNQSTKRMEISSNLQKFLDELVRTMIRIDCKSLIVFGIFWRQSMSLLKASKGTKIFFILHLIHVIVLSLNLREKLLFAASIKIVLKRGLI